ncbi:MAG: GAF domain-containing sensor histidine kinase [Acidobacteriota bacterium]
MSATFALLWWRERRRSRLELGQRTRELLALHAAGLEIYGGLDLPIVLQQVADSARELLNARYSALSVISGDHGIQSFLTSGMSAEVRARIGDPPQGRGLLAVPLVRGERLRLRDMAHDPRAEGFPPHHPAMHSLLAVPVVCKSPFRGNLYVTERLDGKEFTLAEEETLARVAAKAALAIDTAHLHQQLNSAAVFEERLHIAHELHDGMVQMLAYVNTKAQAAREFLNSGRQAEGMAQLNQLASVAREVYADAREGILGLRTSISEDQSIGTAVRHFVEIWQEQSAVPVTLDLDENVQVDARSALQLIRVLQEALVNVRKHAGADGVDVRLHRVGTAVELAVEDDGIGFDSDAPATGSAGSFGLATMRERVQSVGGSLTLETAPGRGTKLRFRLDVATDKHQGRNA